MGMMRKWSPDMETALRSLSQMFPEGQKGPLTTAQLETLREKYVVNGRNIFAEMERGKSTRIER